MRKISAPIPFAGFQIDKRRQVCAFFNGENEEYCVLLSLWKRWVQCGHKAIHMVNADQRGDRLQRLGQAGFDRAAEQTIGASY